MSLWGVFLQRKIVLDLFSYNIQQFLLNILSKNWFNNDLFFHSENPDMYLCDNKLVINKIWVLPIFSSLVIHRKKYFRAKNSFFIVLKKPLDENMELLQLSKVNSDRAV